MESLKGILVVSQMGSMVVILVKIHLEEYLVQIMGQESGKDWL